MNVALLGFGTVGQAVARRLADVPGVSLTHVFNRDVARKQVDWIPSARWTERIDAVFAARPDVVIEVIGGRAPAGEWVRRALSSGAHVVTANKQLIAYEGPELLRLAVAHDRVLAFEASVAGGVPVVRGIGDGLAGDRLQSVTGILNGTCNVILSAMESGGATFDAALRDARRAGFAEADPSDDLDGLDARAKLCILARVALGRSVSPDVVPCGTIRTITGADFAFARQVGRTVRQVAHARLADAGNAVEAWVRPALVPAGSTLGRTTRNTNAVITRGQHGGDVTFSGFGAGGGPTAVAIVSDLVAIQRGVARPATTFADSIPAEVTVGDPLPCYVRFTNGDDERRRILDALAARGVETERVLQPETAAHGGLALIVRPVPGSRLDAALSDLTRSSHPPQPPVWLPLVD